MFVFLFLCLLSVKCTEFQIYILFWLIKGRLNATLFSRIISISQKKYSWLIKSLYYWQLKSDITYLGQNGTYSKYSSIINPVKQKLNSIGISIDWCLEEIGVFWKIKVTSTTGQLWNWLKKILNYRWFRKKYMYTGHFLYSVGPNFLTRIQVSYHFISI